MIPSSLYFVPSSTNFLAIYVPWMLAPGLLCFFPLCLLTSSLSCWLIQPSNLTLPLHYLFQGVLHPVHFSFLGPCYLPDDTLGTLSLENLPSAHILSFLALIYSPPAVLVPWALWCSLASSCLPNPSYLLWTPGSVVTVISPTPWFSHSLNWPHNLPTFVSGTVLLV